MKYSDAEYNDWSLLIGSQSRISQIIYFFSANNPVWNISTFRDIFLAGLPMGLLVLVEIYSWYILTQIEPQCPLCHQESFSQQPTGPISKITIVFFHFSNFECLHRPFKKGWITFGTFLGLFLSLSSLLQQWLQNLGFTVVIQMHGGLCTCSYRNHKNSPVSVCNSAC